jgi:hypothetical protein
MKASCLLLFCILCSFVNAQDIIVASISKTEVGQYERYNGTITIKNDGIVDVNNSFTIVYYLSTDDVLDITSDTYIGSSSVASLAAGSPHSITNIWWPSVPVQSYYLFIVSDYYKKITETDEDNNILVVPDFLITPADVDFELTSLNLNKTSVNAQDIINATLEIQKSGSTDIETQTLNTTFYVSTDAILDASDVIMDYKIISFFGPDKTSINETYTLTVPNVAPDNYYIIAKTDDRRRIPGFTETNEDNNTAVSTSFSVLSTNVDLRATAQFYFSNNFADASLTVYNNGTTPVGGYEITFYLSIDPSFEPSDTRISSHSYTEEKDRIPAGGSVSQYAHLSFYSQPGNYYIICNLNETNSIVETNTSNNLVISQQFTIYPPPTPSITLTQAEFTGTYDDLDQELNLTSQFLNSGNTSSISQNFAIEIKDSNGEIVHTSSQYENFYVSSGASTTTQWLINLTQPLLHGNYSVEIRCATGNECYSNTYTLPLAIDQFVTTLTGVVKGEDGTAITKGKLFLYQKGDDGVVKFINQQTLSGNNDFTFQLDTDQHTLYFIPDKNEFPLYVPTILSKSVILKEECFITISAPTTLDLEILKIIPPVPGGSGIINGSVSSGSISSGRTVDRTQSISPVPVILLSETEQVTGITYTDDSGYFEFQDLPAGKYKIVVSFELDQTQMSELYSIDITNQNKAINIEITSEGIQFNQEVFLKTQSIIFNEFPAKKFKDDPFTLEATTDADLPITFSSSNMAVARIENNQLVIVGAGSSLVTASQAGDVYYKPAFSITRILTVEKADQAIVFAQIGTKTTTDERFTLEASTPSNLQISFASDNVSVASVEGNIVTINGPGTAIVTASQEGNENYNSAQPEARTLFVELITATEQFREDFMVYPNPSPGVLFLNTANEKIKNVSLIDETGKTVTAIHVIDQIDISSNGPGIYFLKIVTPSGTKTFRIVKQ